MSDKICKLIKNLKKENPEEKITLITNKLAIKGNLEDIEDENTYEGTIVLNNVEICKLKHMCCSVEEEKKSIKFNKLYISIDKLLGISTDIH